MLIGFTTSFLGDISSASVEIIKTFNETLQHVKTTDSIADLPEVLKLQSTYNGYRIMSANKQVSFICIVIGDKVTFQRIYIKQ